MFCSNTGSWRCGRIAPAAALVVAVMVAGGVAAGAESQPADDGWQWTVAPYVWGAALDGTVVIRGHEAEVDLSASDILDNLELGAMAMLVARRGDWGVMGDAVWVALGVTTDSPPADIDPTLGMLTLQGVRRLSAFADLTFGVRWNHLDGRIDFKPPVEMEVERTRDWVDPVIGVVLRTSGDRRWHATLIADVGGFGLGSNLTWQVLPTIGFDLSSWSSFELGYRLISTDYDTGAGSQRFEYDILYQGPVAGFAFSF